MNLKDIENAAASLALDVFGAFHPSADHGLAPNIQTLVLLGPKEPGFWAFFQTSPEWQDGKADPIDRWSKRVIGALALEFSAQAFFPFEGPPYHPFFRWAEASGRANSSPVTILIHDTAGLMVSYRGALGFSERLSVDASRQQPCEPCHRPCETACPVSALTPHGYDVAECHDFLDSDAGRDCLDRGCQVRRACPISKTYGRLEEQSAYHMSLFHRSL